MHPTKVTPRTLLILMGVFFLFSILALPSSVFAVAALTPTVNLTASPNPVNSGSPTTLTWSSTNATSCTVTQGDTSGFNTGGTTSGSDSSDPITETTTFAIRCTGAGGTRTDSVVVAINEDTKSSVPPPSTPPSDVRGVFFNPIITLNGNDLGVTIPPYYFQGTVRAQFKNELKAFKEKTGANAVLLWAWPHMGISWPLAEQYQIDGLAMMIKDAKAEGLNTILGTGHPYIVPKSRMLEEGTFGVCDHHAGDVVGGLTLLWDMAPCTEDVITPSKDWFRSVLEGLEDEGVTKNQVAYLFVGGHYKLFYGAEFNMLRGANVHLSDAQAYLSAMIPYLHTITDIPIGISLLPKTLQPTSVGPEDFLANLFAAVPLEQFDVLDITWSPYVKKSEITGFSDLIANAPQKVILSDFKTEIAFQNGMSRANAITHTIDYTKQKNLAGYWMFVYRDMGDSLGLKDVPGNWREDLADAFKDGYDNTPPPAPGGGGGGGGGGSSSGGGSGGSSGQTTPSQQSLLTLLRSLIQQFITAGGTPTPTMLAFLNMPSTGGYTRDLDIGSQGNDVLALQNFLITQNKGQVARALAQVGATGFFGPLTQSALAEYQASVGITPASGYFGPVTRAYINNL